MKIGVAEMEGSNETFGATNRHGAVRTMIGATAVFVFEEVGIVSDILENKKTEGHLTTIRRGIWIVVLLKGDQLIGVGHGALVGPVISVRFEVILTCVKWAQIGSSSLFDDIYSRWTDHHASVRVESGN